MGRGVHRRGDDRVERQALRHAEGSKAGRAPFGIRGSGAWYQRKSRPADHRAGHGSSRRLATAACGAGSHLMAARIGIDVGGTFTDFVLADRTTGRLVRYKEPSVPADPSLSVERGLPPLIERAGIAPADVELVVHGTTLALNAIIQRRGAKLGLVVS